MDYRCLAHGPIIQVMVRVLVKLLEKEKKITLSSQVGVKKCRCGPLYGSLRAVKFGNKRRIVMWLRSVLE